MQKITNPVGFIREVIKNIRGISRGEFLLVCAMVIVLAGMMLGVLGMQQSMQHYNETRVELHNIPVNFEIDESAITKFDPANQTKAAPDVGVSNPKKAPAVEKRELYYDDVHKDWRYK